ncbi:AraC family transcriptional regulator [Dasania sp. GY-MA-18]|uniref:AraC family transcriptional regulator ligand-binding domain-containing protein n=1 Tax=Dasania phycosphaerae TaxID=2950436 RepID=A0A9J6RKZ9_9GAMM|nr:MULTISPECIES: AraC family transcriptional regulator [Dasania]MCR8922959.1 AraC family transcriptional regulator [Dasania sp. GY-MA-18]MCZ0865390.1 AraC family transcriptional regulator ligand-binding domain-containing protein [Dasania phycosphaerae]MCZ0869115.1 AraC family transcriptional regulator ligand-binding domain-containing protein [Dasania phycosphaerae]
MLTLEAHQATNHLASRFLGHYCQLLDKLALQQSVDVPALLVQLGLDAKQAQARITLNQYYRLLALTAPRLQGQGFFLQLGQCFDISDAGVLGYASLSVDNLRQSWELTDRNYALYPHPLTAQRLIDSQRVSLRLNIPAQSINDSRYLQEEWLSATWKWMCQRLPEIAQRKELVVKLAYPAPSDKEYYQRIFPGPVLFDQEHSELSFPLSWYDIPFPSANPATAALCQQQCQFIMNQLASQTDLVEQVQRLLLLSPQRELPSLAEMAQHFHLASHSFHRQLKKSGVSYRQIINEVKMELAKDYLAKTTLPLQEISYLLGYEHAANFYRAFKQQLGMTATEFRNRAEK